MEANIGHGGEASHLTDSSILWSESTDEPCSHSKCYMKENIPTASSTNQIAAIQSVISHFAE
jgi:hypothetical protein